MRCRASCSTARWACRWRRYALWPLCAARHVAALRAHRAALLARRDALNSLLSTLDKTIEQEEGGISMQDTEKFACFKQALVQKNEAQYGAEARKAYGEEAVEAANAKLMGLSEEQFAQMQAAGQKLFGLLREAVAQNAAPGGSLGLQAAQLHKKNGCASHGRTIPRPRTGALRRCICRTSASPHIMTAPQPGAPRSFCAAPLRRISHKEQGAKAPCFLQNCQPAPGRSTACAPAHWAGIRCRRSCSTPIARYRCYSPWTKLYPQLTSRVMRIVPSTHCLSAYTAFWTNMW